MSFTAAIASSSSTSTTSSRRAAAMAAAAAAAAATPRLAACTCQAQARAQALRASSGRRPFSTTSPARVVLTADSLDKNDPRDMKNLQEFKFDDIPFLGHMAIEGDRERLHIMRLIEFQLPEIQKLRRPYKAPTTSQALIIQTAFRSSDPMHPVSRKAVLTTTVGRLVAATGSKLSSKEAQHKLKAIAGPRYDPGSNTLKISSDSYPTVTMNMKWCSDALDRLVEAAADTSDPMTDIPLTTKHAQVKQSKNAHKRRATIADIPKEWLVGLTSGKSQSKEKAVEGGSQKLQLEAGQSEAAPPAVA